MPNLLNNLEIDRCPHCAVAKPFLGKTAEFNTVNHSGKNKRLWYIYICRSCGGVVCASSAGFGQAISEYFPTTPEVDKDIPEKAKSYLEQAIASIHAPAGAVMLAASAVDAMMKERDYIEGGLYSRIEQAAKEHLITKEMAQWAHEVRLDANDQRHADKDAVLPNENDANRIIDFAMALAEFLFVLPSKVQRGLETNE